MPKKATKKATSVKKAATNTAVKSKSAKAPAKAKKAKGRGKRYTPAQKAKVLALVNEVNATKGRGGAAAASRKFGISQITIGQWMKKSGAPAPTSKKAVSKKASAKPGAKRGPKPGAKRGPKTGAKRGPKPGAKRGRKPGAVVSKAAKGGAGFSATLRRLADVHEAIANNKSELVSLEKEYAQLKKGL